MQYRLNGTKLCASWVQKEADALRTQVDLLKSRLLDTDNAHQQELTSLREQHKVDAQQLREKAEDSAKLQQEWQALQDQVKRPMPGNVLPVAYPKDHCTAKCKPSE